MIVSALIFYLFLATTQATKLEPRIVGGSEVKNRTRFSYQASILYTGQHICGGSIISPRHILTAAHCCYPENKLAKPSQLAVVVGNLLLTDRKIQKSVSRVYVHENYKNTNLTYDIAVLRLSDDLIFSDKVNAINLTETALTKGRCNVSGWGAVHYAPPQQLSRTLLYVEIPIYNKSQCNNIYGNINDRMICAGERGKDSCQGDSGGPLVCSNNLTGIVSFGANCGIYPGVYTEVAKYRDWIERVKSEASRVMLTSVFVVFIFTIFQFVL